MGIFTININEDVSVTSGARISSMGISAGVTTFIVSGATAADDITIGIKITNLSGNPANIYYAQTSPLIFTPANSGVEQTKMYTISFDPITYSIVFYDSPDLGPVLVEVRLISSTGTLSNVDQYKSIIYTYGY